MINHWYKVISQHFFQILFNILPNLLILCYVSKHQKYLSTTLMCTPKKNSKNVTKFFNTLYKLLFSPHIHSYVYVICYSIYNHVLWYLPYLIYWLIRWFHKFGTCLFYALPRNSILGNKERLAHAAFTLIHHFCLYGNICLTAFPS